MVYLIAVDALLLKSFHANMSTGELLWQAFGLFANVLWTARFIVQWIHSERQKTSIVPVSFWWISVWGTVVNCAYIVHQRQWIILIGNAPQIIPYTRNLVLIYRRKRLDEAAAQAMK